MLDGILQSLGFSELSPLCQVLAAIVAVVIGLTGGWGAGRSIVRASLSTVRTGLKAGRYLAGLLPSLRRRPAVVAAPLPPPPPSKLFERLSQMLLDDSLWEISNAMPLVGCDLHLRHLSDALCIGFFEGEPSQYHCSVGGLQATAGLRETEQDMLDDLASECLDAVLARCVWPGDDSPEQGSCSEPMMRPCSDPKPATFEVGNPNSRQRTLREGNSPRILRG